MNSKLWIKKALSLCLVVATIATCSTVNLATTEKVAGELLISGKNLNDNTSFVKVNGESAQNGRSIFSSSTVVTSENAGAVINLGKLGKVELSPATTLNISFNENGISGDLLAGRVTVLKALDAVNIKTLNGTVNLKAGEFAVATTGNAQDDDAVSDGGSGWIVWALVLGGAAAGIIIAATSDNNRISLGGTSTVISPTR
ncbi:MAG: hypothetical protein M3R11_02125 [Acidobacteriota bacterium]|nr:hypothetical protein [Acidobacteriota bacterium]